MIDLRPSFLIILLVTVSALGQQLEPRVTPSLPAGNASAVGDLLVSPTRLVFQGPRRTAEVTLINIGPTPATYRISLMHLRMNPDGTVVEFGEASAEDRVADSLVRYSPRQVTLEPRVVQTVRIQLRKPAELAAGEYRSHLLFRGIPKVDDVVAETEEATSLSVRLIPIYGVSIPLIVRHGETSARVALSGLELVPGGEGQAPFYVKATLEREGNRSVYGNFRVSVPRAGRGEVVGAVDGIAIYAGLDARTVLIPVRPAEGMVLNGSRLRVALFDAEQGEAGEDLLAEAFLDIP